MYLDQYRLNPADFTTLQKRVLLSKAGVIKQQFRSGAAKSLQPKYINKDGALTDFGWMVVKMLQNGSGNGKKKKS